MHMWRPYVVGGDGDYAVIYMIHPVGLTVS